jgi:hypothetical protein
VVGCSRVGSRAATPALVRTSRTVRVVGADCPRGAFWPKCSSCSSRVLERLHFDPVGQRFLVGRCLVDHPPGHHELSRVARVARGPSEDVVRTIIGGVQKFRRVPRTGEKGK